jgi:hypothetical protein
MKSQWNDQNLEQVLRSLKESEKDTQASERVWARIETRLADRKSSWLSHKVWRPMGHPIRWVVAASFLFVAFGGVLYQHQLGEQADMNAYLLNISNPTENIGKDSGYVKVSSIISEAPSQEGVGILIGDEDHPGVQMSGDDPLL